MPAALEDPTQPPHYRPDIVVPELEPLTVLLKDGETTATIYPIFPNDQLPFGLLAFLCDEFNVEIERGDTYPLFDTLHIDTFQNYWFGSFAAIMLLGDSPTIQDSRQWEKECLGTFYVKPNYPGRCSHICTAGFLVNAGIRGKGIGRTLAECYLEWAPKLGYSYSVFNLVFETNVAACRIWESLHFTRIGRVKDAGILKGHESAIDAIIYGRDLIDAPEDMIEQRFDRIKYYLETGRYPPQSDRQEKSRLRSSAAHYKLVDNKLMLKGREVISDPERQLEIATEMHMINHAGINKTTSQITEKYHWTRIKSTVSMAIRNCAECRETTRPAPKRVKRDITIMNTAVSSASNASNSAVGSTHSIDFNLGNMSSGNVGGSSGINSNANQTVSMLGQSSSGRHHHHHHTNEHQQQQHQSQHGHHIVHSNSTTPPGYSHGTPSSHQQQSGPNLAPGLVSIPGGISIHNSSSLHHLSGLASQVQQREQQQQQQQDQSSQHPQDNRSHLVSSVFDPSVGMISSSGQGAGHRVNEPRAQEIAAHAVAEMANQQQHQQQDLSASDLEKQIYLNGGQSSRSSDDNDIPVDPQINAAFESRRLHTDDDSGSRSQGPSSSVPQKNNGGMEDENDSLGTRQGPSSSLVSGTDRGHGPVNNVGLVSGHVQNPADGISVSAAHELAAAATTAPEPNSHNPIDHSGNSPSGAATSNDTQIFQDDLFQTAAAVAAAAVAADMDMDNGNGSDTSDEGNNGPRTDSSHAHHNAHHHSQQAASPSNGPLNNDSEDTQQLVAAAAQSIDDEMNAEDFSRLAEIATRDNLDGIEGGQEDGEVDGEDIVTAMRKSEARQD